MTNNHCLFLYFNGLLRPFFISKWDNKTFYDKIYSMRINKWQALFGIIGIIFIPQIVFADLIIPFFDYGFNIILLPIVIVIESIIAIFYIKKFLNSIISAKKSFVMIAVANIVTYILGYILTINTFNINLTVAYYIYFLLFAASSVIEGIVFLLFIRKNKIKLFLLSIIANFASYSFLLINFYYKIIH